MLKRAKVEDALLKTGMPSGLKGFRYIVDAVLLLDTPEWAHPKFTALYEKIGKINGTTGSRVERAIRHAFEAVRESSGSQDMISYYLGYDSRKNSSSLTMLFTRLSHENAGEAEEEGINLKTDKTAYLRKIIREEVRSAMNDFFQKGVQK